MNFTTKNSQNNTLVFEYSNGFVKSTQFDEIGFYGDDYILAKSSTDLFYSILDVDGNLICKDKNIIHRFDNGSLLTYSAQEKRYTSSDKITYTVNYNVYSVYNFTSGVNNTVMTIQSDSLFKKKSIEAPIVVSQIMGLNIYRYNDIMFSELHSDRFLFTASLTMVNPMSFNLDADHSSVFELISSKNVWNVTDSKIQSEFDTTCTAELSSGKTLHESQKFLFAHCGPYKVNTSSADQKINYKYKATSQIYSRLRKRVTWPHIFKNVLSYMKINVF